MYNVPYSHRNLLPFTPSRRPINKIVTPPVIFLPFGVKPLRAETFVPADSPLIAKVHQGRSQDAEGRFYFEAVTHAGDPVKVLAPLFES